MLSNVSTISNVADAITVLVEYGNQLKPISVTQKDDLSSIEHKIYERFKFNTEQMKNLQIQWYDDDFKNFIDLDSETWSKYAKNQFYLENNIHSDSQKHLKLVHKQLFKQHNGPKGQRQVEINGEQDADLLSLKSSYIIINKTLPDHTSGITEHRIGSQLERMNESIHTDWVLNGLGWLLPLISVLTFAGDGLWINLAYDPDSKEQHNYAGLISTILLLFYYLQYDVKINLTHPKLYLIYQSGILCCVLAGDILYAYYYGHHIQSKFLMGIFIAYGIIDSAFVCIVGYLKYYRQYRVSMGLSIHNLFHLMSRLEVLLIILIPIFTTYEVVSTNSIAFFILYEFFSHSYNNPDLIYSGYSRLSFWLLIILATATVICENFEYVYDRQAQDADEAHDQKNEERYYKIAFGFLCASNVMEICASLACYALLLLQFFSKSDKQKRMAPESYEIQTE